MRYNKIRTKENTTNEREDKNMTKTTKNVTITEGHGFTVRNNYQVIATTSNRKEAERIAYEIAKKENKKVAINYFFGEIRRTYNLEQMKNLVGA